KLLLVGFQVRKQPDLFQDLEGQVLRLVDDEDNVASPLDPLQQGTVDLRHQIMGARSDRGFAQFGQNGAKHLALGDVRVENERGIVVGGIELVEETPAERSLAAAHLPDEQDEAFLLLHAIFEVLQGLLMRRAQIEKLRVRSDIERHLRETVESLIHDTGRISGPGKSETMQLVLPARQADNPPPGKIFNCAIAPANRRPTIGRTVRSKPDSTGMARRVAVWIYAGVFIGVGLLSGVFFFQTYQEFAQLRRVEADTRLRLAQAEQRLQDQERVLDRLRNDPAFVEKIIRLRLRYAKPSELIFRFEE